MHKNYKTSHNHRLTRSAGGNAPAPSWFAHLCPPRLCPGIQRASCLLISKLPLFDIQSSIPYVVAALDQPDSTASLQAYACEAVASLASFEKHAAVLLSADVAVLEHVMRAMHQHLSEAALQLWALNAIGWLSDHKAFVVTAEVLQVWF